MGLVADLRQVRSIREREGMLDEVIARSEAAYAEGQANLGLMQERLAELELALEDTGWQALGEGTSDFGADARRNLVRLSRVMYLKNPIIRRGVNVQVYYVMGQGVSIQAPDPDVNEVVQDFLDDPANRAVLTDPVVLQDSERDLQTDGELFLALFTDVVTGRVIVRRVKPEQITDVITNPDDEAEPWYYERRWSAVTIDDAGASTSEEKRLLYPALGYRPEGPMPQSFRGAQVATDLNGFGGPVRMLHVKVGGVSGMTRGLPDTYAALDWARAYKDFLTDVASIMRSLSRWAWKASVQRGKVGATKDKLNTALGTSTGGIDTNPPPIAGSVAVVPEGADLTPMPKTGSTVNPDDGKALRLMAAAALDIPDTILSNDPQQGALATAKTLDRPTELAMRTRQTLWEGVIRTLTEYVVEASVLSTSGLLKGTVTTTRGRVYVDLGQDPETGEPRESTVTVHFPPILEQDVLERMNALKLAAVDLSALPAEEKARLVLSALGVTDVDPILADLFPEEGDGGAPAPGADGTPTPTEAFAEAASELREAVEAWIASEPALGNGHREGAP